MPLTTSDSIQLLVMFITTITSVASIIIAVKTLQQNNKMIEDSTRPVISVYSKYVDGTLHIITKNFGSSPCTIDYIKSDMNLTQEESQSMQGNPFENTNGATLPPNGRLVCSLIPYKLKTKCFTFEIKYHSRTHSYVDKFFLDCAADNPFPDMYSTVRGTDEACEKISKTLEGILKTKL